jgi:hypothetical protein
MAKAFEGGETQVPALFDRPKRNFRLAELGKVIDLLLDSVSH